MLGMLTILARVMALRLCWRACFCIQLLAHMLGKLHCRLRDNQRIQMCARENRRSYGKAGAFHNGFAQMNCWICGACNAGTREHRVKASDLKSLFGTPNQKAPLYLNSNARQRNVRIGSLKSDRLKYKQPICLACNSALTQPHDEAWRHASDKLRGNVPRLLRGGSFRSNWLFPHNTRLGMRYLHLYFVKLFGCQIVEGKIPIDIAPFAKAILDGRPHPGLFIGFGHLSGLPKKFAGGSDVLVKCLNGEVICASWFYQVGDLCVKVMYATLGEHPDGLKTAWNPRQGSKRLFFVTL